MSIDKAKEKCVVCHAYLFEEDDVVYCPECGAPHHRDCYNAVGHCALDVFHGTEDEYKKPEPKTESQPEQRVVANGERPIQRGTVVCGMCGEKYDITEDVCPNCNTPNVIKANGGRFAAFDFLGGVPPKTDLGNGVIADDAKKFVVTNTHRYIPKFLNFKNGKKASWNWLAFLTPCGWLMSRKMYVFGAVIGAVQIALAMLCVPFTAAVNQLGSSAGYIELMDMISQNASSIGKVAFFAAFVGSLLDLVLRIVLGIYGDLIYNKRVISKVAEINRNSDDKINDYRKKGGVSIIIGALGYFAVTYLPNIIAYTMGLL